MNPRRDNPVFREAPGGRLLAVRNWRYRTRRDDALVAVPLTEQELERYRQLKAEGRSDEAIFDELFVPAPTERVTLPLEALQKAQLLMLLGQLLDADLPSLSRMTRGDLLVLTRALCRSRRGCESFLV